MVERYEEERLCRNCHEGGRGLIAPCQCTGTIKWVHRDCLNTWRTVSPNPMSFYRCDLCHTPYRLRRKPVAKRKKFAFVLKCVRDVLAVLLAVVLTVVLCGLVMWGFDSLIGLNAAIFGTSTGATSTVWFKLFVDGSALMFFVIGIVGIFAGIVRMCGSEDGCCSCCSCCYSRPAYTYDNYGYNSFCPPWWWWWCMWSPPQRNDCDCCDCSGCNCSGSDCNCSGGDCNCSGNDGDAGAVILVIVAVIVAIIIALGFFIGMALLCYFCYKIITNHIHILKLEQDAQEFEVVDISKEPIPGADEVILDIPEPTAPPQQENESENPKKPLFENYD